MTVLQGKSTQDGSLQSDQKDDISAANVVFVIGYWQN